MRKFKVRIKGVAPILFNRVHADELGAVRGRRTQNDAADAEEVERKVYRNEEQHLCVPAINIKQSIIIGTKMSKLKYGKPAAWRYLEPLVFITPVMVPFMPLRTEYDGVDSRVGRRPPKTGGRVVVRRPFIKEGWVLEFEALLVDDAFPVDIVQQAFINGGLFAGLCDFRPEFGRYLLETFEQIPVK